MKIIATSLVVGGGIALTSDDNSGGNEVYTVMLRPGETHVVSDRMRSARSVRQAITLGYITVVMDSGIDDTIGPGSDHSDFVAQVELNALANLVSGVSGLISGLSGFSGAIGVHGTKYFFLDIHGGADTAEIQKINGTPYLVFNGNAINRSAWTWTIPDDYVSGTPIIIEVYWSPSSNAAGNVRWILEYKSVVPGGSVASSLLTSIFVQPSPGTMSLLTTTGTALSIPGGAVMPNALLTLSVKRDGQDASDTFTGQAWVHLVRISYTGIKFST